VPDPTPQTLREALTRTFNASELETFISDHFPDALKDIPSNAALSEQAQKLVTNCQRRDALGALVAAIKAERPNAFDPLIPKKDTLPRRAQFFGRVKEKEKVMRALNPDDRSWGIVLDGIGGIGKTALAVECAHMALAQKLFDAAVFVSAKTNILLSGEIKDLNPIARTVDEFVNETARALGREAVTQERGADKSRAMLAALRGSRTLLIFDNLETLNQKDHEGMADWLRDLPTGCKALLTSRRRGGEGAVWLRLDKLEDEAALELIKAEMDKDEGLAAKFNRAPPVRWQALVDEAAGSPLALTSVLGLLRKRASLSVDGAIDLLRHKDADADLLRFVFQEARKELTDNDAKALLALSYFVPSASFEAWMETAELSRAALENSIDRLNTLSLLVLGEGEERYALHPLTRGYVRLPEFSGEAERAEAAMRFARYWVEFAEQFGGNANDSYKTYAKLEAEWDNLNAAVELLSKELEFLKDSSSSTTVVRMLIDIADALNQFMLFSGRWNESSVLSSRWYEMALNVEDWSSSGWGAYNTAWIYFNRVETEDAQVWVERALQAWERGGSKGERAEGERLLGLVAKQRGDYQTAQLKFDVALVINRDIGDKEGEGLVLNGLGSLASEQENYDLAEEHFREALVLAQKIENVEMQSFITSNLGLLEIRREDYAQARVWLEQSLSLAQVVGRQDLISTCKYLLAKVCEAEGKHNEALILAWESVEVLERLQDGDATKARAFLEQL
jgi:tetratricopeptide (TPR) repeat protein